jgi:hypothetical protein
MNLIRIEANAVDIIWTRVKDLLQSAINLNLGEFTIEDVKEYLLKGRMNLWVVLGRDNDIILAAVTEFVNYPREKRLRVLLTGAKKNTLRKWFKQCWQKDSELLKFARENDVKRFEVLVRDGWVRLLPKVGFKKYCTVLTMEVN